MKVFPALLALFATFAVSGASFAATKPPGCGIYAQVERACPCGAKGYALGYGRKYCRRFAALDGLSAKGRRWRDATIACLQETLREALPDEPAGCDCAKLKRAAYASHFSCYVLAPVSFCDLPADDLALIHRSIDRTDRRDAQGLRLTLKLAARCYRDNPENTREARREIRRLQRGD